MKTDVLIVGGGTGGCAAAMAVTAMGFRAVLTEETDWLGGQLTSQAVPSDEHPWIESHGCTARYRRYRNAVRQYYRDHYPLLPAARDNPYFNPGGGRVSRLCHEPRVSVAVIEQMLAYGRSAGRLVTLLEHRAIGVDTDGDRVRSVVLQNMRDGGTVTIEAPYILDATELGDLLPLAGVEYVVGAESREKTGEPHAPPGPPRPENVQAITWCFPMGFDASTDANHTIDKPFQYERWRDYVPALKPAWTGRLLDPVDAHPITLAPRKLAIFPQDAGKMGTHGSGGWWTYRRIVTTEHYPQGAMPEEVTLVNWPRNDYFVGSIIDQPEARVIEHLAAAKQLSLSLLYWLQTEAPRPDGGQGYPGLHLRPDITGTRDGLAKSPYIRESRRIQAQFTVTELHVGTEVRGGYDIHSGKPRPAHESPAPQAEPFADSVGVGCYRIDLHPSTGGDNYIDISSLPFRIPLGALLPVRVENLLPACKNIGTTHITNGCYRLHPVEWNIGESAGLLAAFCLMKGLPPRAVRERRETLGEFQDLLRRQEVELEWPGTRPV